MQSVSMQDAPLMSASWREFLGASGARFAHERVADFGDSAAELTATGGGAAVIADLSHLAVLGFAGDDAIAFLQGQLSCDVAALSGDATGWGAYSTPQGRMLASFQLAREGPIVRMLLARSIAASVAKRLRMFVLRSKVTITDDTDAVALLGLAGVEPSGVAGRWHRIAAGRFIGIVPAAEAPGAWRTLTASARPVGVACWEWLDIEGGLPLITAATQDQLVPQMANLDLIGGISFTKGCYPGQEIVARTKYLGRIKRRMMRAHVIAEPPPAAGDAIYAAEFGDQASGTIVNTAPSPRGGHDVLAVLQLATIETADAHLRALDGPRLTLRAPPYPLA